MHVIADGRGFDFEVIQELLGLARVFAGDAVGLAQDAEGAEGDVFEIADGSGDQVETRGEGLVVAAVGRKVHREINRRSFDFAALRSG